MNMGIKLYNELPNEVGEVKKTRQFKIQLGSYPPQQTIYSVDKRMSF
jgi:exo-beta-1,3-glucanase (GH17 family)